MLPNYQTSLEKVIETKSRSYKLFFENHIGFLAQFGSDKFSFRYVSIERNTMRLIVKVRQKFLAIWQGGRDDVISRLAKASLEIFLWLN